MKSIGAITPGLTFFLKLIAQKKLPVQIPLAIRCTQSGDGSTFGGDY